MVIQVIGYLKYIRDFVTFMLQYLQSINKLPISFKAYVTDWTSHPIDPHYIYHTAWAARKLAQIKPSYHIDIGSFLYFSTISSAFIKIKYLDYRPANVTLANYETGSVDLTDLPFKSESIKSLSCLHTIEHIGLGRYGDPVNINGDIKVFKELARVMASGGDLLVVFPMAEKISITFNAHRIYNYSSIIKYFSKFKLHEFSFVNDSGVFLAKATENDVVGQKYGCGCFWFKKKQ